MGWTLDLDVSRRRTGLGVLGKPLLVDRGRAVAVASGVRKRRASAHVVRLSDYEQFLINAPLSPALRRAKARPRLLWYDREHQRSGWLLTLRRGHTTERVYVPWHVGSPGVGPMVELSHTGRRGEQGVVEPLGYSPHAGVFWAAELRYSARARRQHRAVVIALDADAEPSLVASFDSERRFHGVYFDAGRERALVVEYAEKPVRGPPPIGHLIDLHTGARTQLPMPATAYGIAFGADGRTLHAYASQGGALWRIDTESGARSVLRPAGGLGHALGPAAGEDSLLLIRNSSVYLIDSNTGRRRAALSTRRLFGGFAHTEGSVVAAGQAVVKNGDMIAFVRVERPGATSR